MKLLKKISEKFGFTVTEIQVILFFVFLTVLGAGYKYFDANFSISKKFSYSKDDSLYTALVNEANTRNGYKLNVQDIMSGVQRDSLDSTSTTSNADLSETKLAKGSIAVVNINTSGVAEMATLPGIGIKTAEAIVDYRKSIGKFSRLEQIMDVKGIGQKKFDKIRTKIAL